MDKKISPFELKNQGETIDDNFFVRLKRMENCIKEISSTIPDLKAIKKINIIFQEDLLSVYDIKEAVKEFNLSNSKPHTNELFWNDLRLHLRHLAFVFGVELTFDENLNVIEKN